MTLTAVEHGRTRVKHQYLPSINKINIPFSAPDFQLFFYLVKMSLSLKLKRLPAGKSLVLKSR